MVGQGGSVRNYLELRLGGSPVLLGRASAFPPEVKPVHAMKGRVLAERLAGSTAALDEIRWRCDSLALSPTVRQANDRQLVAILAQQLERRKLVFVSLGSSASALVPPVYRPGGGLPSRPVGEWTTGEKIEEVLRRTIDRVPAEARDFLSALLTPEAIGAAVGMLVAVAAANAMGVGVVLDAALAAYAFYSAGTAGLRALADLVSATAGLIRADSSDDLDRAAEVYAASLVVLGSAFVQRFVNGARTRADKVRGVSRPGEGAGAAAGGRANVPAKKDYKAHNQDGPADARDFRANRGGKTRRSAADRRAQLKLEELDYDAEDAAQIVSSARQGSFKPVRLAKNDELYAFTTTGKGKKADSAYWMTKQQYEEVKGKFQDPSTGRWDRAGVKEHLALPCYNKVDSFVRGRVTETHDALASTVGEATETVIYKNGTTQQTLYGGGGQVTPKRGAIKLLGEGLPP